MNILCKVFFPLTNHRIPGKSPCKCVDKLYTLYKWLQSKRGVLLLNLSSSSLLHTHYNTIGLTCKMIWYKKVWNTFTTVCVLVNWTVLFAVTAADPFDDDKLNKVFGIITFPKVLIANVMIIFL